MRYQPYVHGKYFDRMRFDPPHRGSRVVTAEVKRPMYTALIYRGRLVLTDGRPRFFDRRRFFRKLGGWRISLLKDCFGRRETDALLHSHEEDICNSK